MPQVSQHYILVLQNPVATVADSLQSTPDSLSSVRLPEMLSKYTNSDAKVAFQMNADSLLKTNFGLVSPDSLTISKEKLYGFEGTPLTIGIESSAAVQSMLLISLLLTTFAIGVGYRYFEQLIRNMFKVRDRSSYIVENSVVGFEFKACMTLQTLILESLVGYNLIRELFFLHILHSHYLFGIALFAIVFLIYHIFRILTITFLSSTFSEQRSMRLYVSEYLTLMSFFGVLLLPMVIAMLFWHLSATILLIFFSFIVIFGRISYIAKGFKIFLIQNRSVFYIILYLCALEILPIIVLFQVLVYTYSFSL